MLKKLYKNKKKYLQKLHTQKQIKKPIFKKD
jgi:hypothetical protein